MVCLIKHLNLTDMGLIARYDTVSFFDMHVIPLDHLICLESHLRLPIGGGGTFCPSGFSWVRFYN